MAAALQWSHPDPELTSPVSVQLATLDQDVKLTLITANRLSAQVIVCVWRE